ncbi:MAG: response regulator [Bacteroidetes bacterium]|nr:response regulator [Bacteroidota bacterium]
MKYSNLIVFVIEDDISIRSLLRRIIEKNFQILVNEFGSPVGAFKAMGSVLPDLIILDIHTPHISGFQAMQTIAANERLKNIPVVACTGDSSPELIKRLISLGVKEYLLKPFDPQVLSDRLEVLFDEILEKKAEESEKDDDVSTRKISHNDDFI